MRVESISCVYAIRHRESGRVYVGGTNNLRIRWKYHRGTLNRGIHKNSRLQEAWVTFGPSAFELIVLEPVANLAILRDCEQRWLDHLRAATPEYGFNIDWDSRGRTGRKRTPESVERTAAAHRGRKRPPETGAKISAKALGRVAHNRRFTDEQIAVMRAQLASGVSDSQVGREYGAAPQVIRRIRLGESYPVTG